MRKKETATLNHSECKKRRPFYRKREAPSTKKSKIIFTVIVLLMVISLVLKYYGFKPN